MGHPNTHKHTYIELASFWASQCYRIQITSHWFCSKWIMIESLMQNCKLGKQMSLTQMLTGAVCVLSLWVSWQTSFADWQRPQRQKYLSTRHIKWQDGNKWQGFLWNSLLHVNFLFSFMFQGRCVYRARQSSPVCVCVCVSKWREGLCCRRPQIVSNFK